MTSERPYDGSFGPSLKGLTMKQAASLQLAIQMANRTHGHVPKNQILAADLSGAGLEFAGPVGKFMGISLWHWPKQDPGLHIPVLHHDTLIEAIRYTFDLEFTFADLDDWSRQVEHMKAVLLHNLQKDGLMVMPSPDGVIVDVLHSEFDDQRHIGTSRVQVRWMPPAGLAKSVDYTGHTVYDVGFEARPETAFQQDVVWDFKLGVWVMASSVSGSRIPRKFQPGQITLDYNAVAAQETYRQMLMNQVKTPEEIMKQILGTSTGA